MTQNPVRQTFSDDSPKTDPSEDLLGYRPFAERLADLVLNLDAPNGYVIGLHGAWGSGKSTVLNFVKSVVATRLEDRAVDTSPLIVVSFRPWIVSGHHDLVGAFFKVLAEALSAEAVAREKRRKWWQKLIQKSADPAAAIATAVASIGAMAHPDAAITIKAGAPVAANWVKTSIDQRLAEPSLQSAYEKLSDDLQASGQRILVIIDDIDRLEDSEIWTVMQLVKSVGNLPNVLYLLAYDRRIVWAALDGHTPRSEGQPRFAEKIVQHELELPPPGRRALLRLLDAGIDFVTAESAETVRLYEIVTYGLNRWINYPRDVLRLTNSVRFAWATLKDEIDPQDLVCMEAMRLFDYPLFNWIRRNRDFLFSKGRFLMHTEEQDEAVGEALRNGLPADTCGDQVRILCALFPTNAKAIRGSKSGFEGGEAFFETMKRRGIGTEPGYDAYFNLFPSGNAIPKSLVDYAVSDLGDLTVQAGCLADAMARKDESGGSLIGDYLAELTSRLLGQNAVQPSQVLLDALFAIGEDVLRLDQDYRGIFEISPRMRMRMCFEEMLKAWKIGGADGALLSAFEKATSPAFCADVWCDRARELSALPSGGRHLMPLISTDGLVAIGRPLLSLIEAHAKAGTLDAAPYYFAIATAWAYLAGTSDAVRQWLSEGMLRSAAFLAKVSYGLLSYTSSAGGSYWVMSRRPTEPYYDLAVIWESCERHSSSSGLSDDELARIAALRRGREELARQGAIPT